MMNLDSILKNRDLTLPTKVHIVKAMIFPVVMYGCESWTTEKAKHQRIDAFKPGAAIAVCLQQPLRELDEAFCAPGNSKGQVFR